MEGNQISAACYEAGRHRPAGGPDFAIAATFGPPAYPRTIRCNRRRFGGCGDGIFKAAYMDRRPDVWSR